MLKAFACYITGILHESAEQRSVLHEAGKT